MTKNTCGGIEQLLGIVQQLRDPDAGCAWDVKQTFQSIAPFTLEEAYEVVDAIERQDMEDLKDELGDLLLQVVFHAQIATELGAFKFGDVVEAIVDKMIRRHPHVFAGVVYDTEQELKHGWEAIKARERSAKLSAKNQPESPLTSTLDGIATRLQALKRADSIQKRASSVGFDWPDIEPVWSKLDEEISELKEAIANKKSSDIEDEMGDLFFTLVNLARHCSVDSELALMRATRKFEHRFKRVESQVAQNGKRLTDMTMAELNELWANAKADYHGS